MLSFTLSSGTLAASRPAMPQSRRARHHSLVGISLLFAFVGAAIAAASLKWQLVGAALCHGGTLAALVLGIMAAVTRQPGALAGLAPALLFGGLTLLEPWLPPVLLNLLQALML